jgi:hypothetical protein
MAENLRASSIQKYSKDNQKQVSELLERYIL